VGVLVTPGTHNAILSNVIFNNPSAPGTGITLGAGANDSMQSPTITALDFIAPWTAVPAVIVDGTIVDTPGNVDTIQVFDNPPNDPEGKVQLQTLSVTIGASGVGTFT